MRASATDDVIHWGCLRVDCKNWRGCMLRRQLIQLASRYASTKSVSGKCEITAVWYCRKSVSDMSLFSCRRGSILANSLSGNRIWMRLIKLWIIWMNVSSRPVGVDHPVKRNLRSILSYINRLILFQFLKHRTLWHCYTFNNRWAEVQIS